MQSFKKSTLAWNNGIDTKVNNIIKDWYTRLGFPNVYDEEFYEALGSVNISDAITLDTYDKKCRDGKRNLLSYLFLCEQTERKYKELGISEDILTDTLSDIVTWCNNWSKIKGELYLGELSWLAHHLSGRLFRLGRLQFCMAGAERDIPKYGIRKGDNVIEIHIPEGKKLMVEDSLRSIAAAREFFATHFPDYQYSVFTCHSWLLDTTLKEFLPEESGILQFGNMFDKVEAEESLALIKYLFAWDTTLMNIAHRYPTSSLAAKVQKSVLGGKRFYEVLGVIERNFDQGQR